MFRPCWRARARRVLARRRRRRRRLVLHRELGEEEQEREQVVVVEEESPWAAAAHPEQEAWAGRVGWGEEADRRGCQRLFRLIEVAARNQGRGKGREGAGWEIVSSQLASLGGPSTPSSSAAKRLLTDRRRHSWLSPWYCSFVTVCICVWFREREREGRRSESVCERESVCVSVCGGGDMGWMLPIEEQTTKNAPEVASRPAPSPSSPGQPASGAPSATSNLLSSLPPSSSLLHVALPPSHSTPPTSASRPQVMTGCRRWRYSRR